MKSLFIVLAVGAGGWLLLVLLAWVFQERLLYIPSAPSAASPSDRGWEYEEVFLKAGDGVRLHGWFLPVAGARGAVLFNHSNAGNISHRMETLAVIRELGLSCLIYDYRGYGKSRGSPTEEGLSLDARAAWDHLVNKRRYGPGGIVVWGRSLGAAVAARLATELADESEKGPACLILESAFASVPEVGRRHYPFLPVAALCRNVHPTARLVSKVDCPVLVVHSSRDEIVPVDQGRKIFEAASEPKSFLEITGDHNTGFLLSGETYTSGLRDFLAVYGPGGAEEGNAGQGH